MTLNKFRKTVQRGGIDNKDTIKRLVKLMREMPLREMFSSGCWPGENPLYSVFSETEGINVGYMTLVHEAEKDRKGENDVEKAEFRDLMVITSAECQGFSPDKYNIKRGGR